MSTPALRLWMGWRLPSLMNDATGWTSFVDRLAKTFVPATWQVMPEFGLVTYMPSVLAPSADSPLPDEVALLIYKSTADYERHKSRVLGRSYSLMHGALFDFETAERRSTSAWAQSQGHQAGKAWRRGALAAGPRLDDPGASLHFAALVHPRLPSLTATQLSTGLASFEGEVAAWAMPSFTLVWLAAYQALERSAIEARLQGLQPGAVLQHWHVGLKHPPWDELNGVELTSDKSLHFTEVP